MSNGPLQKRVRPARAELPWARRDTQILLILVLIAALLRFLRLGHPPDLVFDETYYAKDACLYLGSEPEFCGLMQDSEQSYVHPSVGKWLIAIGIKLFGYSSYGWRFAAAVFGTALVVVVFLLTRQLFKNRWTAGIAGLLTATDFLLIVESRIAMLDIFLAFFVTLGFLFLAIDRDAVLRIKESIERGGSRYKLSYLRHASGAALGVAMSIKWSAIFALAAAFGLAAAWSVGTWRLGRRHLRGRGPSGQASIDAPDSAAGGSQSPNPVPDSTAESEILPPTLGRSLSMTVVAFVVIPGLVYMASYAPYLMERLEQPCPFVTPGKGEKRFFGEGFLGQHQGECIRGLKGAALSLADLHERVADYHLTLKAKHPYQSKAWTWPLVLRAVSYHYTHEQDGSDEASEILAFGNIAVWYGALVSAGWLLVAGRRKWAPQRLVVAAWAVQYLPWVVVSRPLFLFYMTPIVPFMMIGLAGGLAALRRRGRVPRKIVTLYLVLGVGAMLLLFYPVLTAIPMPYQRWLHLMWFGRFKCGAYDCGWI